MRNGAEVPSVEDTADEGFGSGGLPEYAAMLAARHTAHRRELRGFIDETWGGCDAAVLDVACGDGFYSEMFAEMLGAAGRVTAVDVSDGFLDWAAKCVAGGESGRISFVKADAERLPFGDEAFDVAWCAQSLISLPDPTAALREMGRVVRRGGSVAVLENDRLHELQMPWPPALEVALRNAEREAEDADEEGDKPHAGRRLESLFRDAGLSPGRRATLAIDRHAPLPAADEMFFQAYLHAAIERASDRLGRAVAEEIRRLADPRSEAYLPAQPDFWMTWTDVVVIATRE